MRNTTLKLIMRSALIGSVSLIPLTGVGAIASAQQQTGSISGIVTDANGLPLEGARISVPGGTGVTFTDERGRFSLTGVESGEVTIEVDYIGAPIFRETITVSGGQSATLNVALLEDDVARMDTLTVIGERVGGINTERRAINKLSAITGESAADLPDINAAEAIQRLPGVYIDEDRGEGRFVSVRGANSSFNSVTLNGVALASPESDGLSVPLDVFAAGGIAGIEVTKSVLPSQPANSIGGQIAIETPTVFGRDHETKFELRGGWHDLGNGERLRASAGVSRTFGDRDQFGVRFDASYSTRDLLAETVEMPDDSDGWDLDDGVPGFAGDLWIPNEIEFRDQQTERERTGLGFVLEWAPDANSRIFAQVNYSNFVEDEFRNRLITPINGEADDIAAGATTIPASALEGAISALGDGQSFSELPSFGVVTSGTFLETTERELDAQRDLTDQEFWIATVGGEWTRGVWDFKTSAGISRTVEDRDRASLDFRIEEDLEGNDLVYDLAFDATGDPSTPTLSFSNGANPLDPSNFRFDDFDIFLDDRVDEIFTLSGDAGRSFELHNSATFDLDFGVRATLRERSINDFGADWNDPEDVDIDGDGDLDDGQNSILLSDPRWLVPNLNSNFLDGAYNFGPGFDPSAIGLFVNDPNSLLTFNNFSDVLEYEAEEDVVAAYAQGSYSIGKWTILGGIRIEQTDFDIVSTEEVEIEVTDVNDNDFDAETAELVSDSNSYTDVFPSLHIRYDFSDDIIFRASAGKTIRRPNYNNLSPERSIAVSQDDRLDDGGNLGPNSRIIEIETGNPQLDPLESINFEVSVDTYFDQWGSIGAALFYKDISNITVDSVNISQVDASALPENVLSLAASDPNLNLTGSYELREFTVDSSSEGEILGLELSYSNKFSFLPAPFDGLGVDANVTFTESEQTINVFDDEVFIASTVFDFEGQSDQSGNVTLAYENGPWEARLTYAFVNGFLNDIAPIDNDDLVFQNVYDQDFGRLGAKVQYELKDGILLTWEGNNLNDEHLDRRFDNSNQLRERERNGWWMEFGVKAKF